eukprot:2361641-Prymnesium_polylepis.1
MKRYRCQTVKCKLRHRATSRAEKEAAKKAAALDQPARASCRVGAQPTCRQRQYIDREGRHRRNS